MYTNIHVTYELDRVKSEWIHWTCHTPAFSPLHWKHQLFARRTHFLAHSGLTFENPIDPKWLERDTSTPASHKVHRSGAAPRLDLIWSEFRWCWAPIKMAWERFTSWHQMTNTSLWSWSDSSIRWFLMCYISPSISFCAAECFAGQGALPEVPQWAQTLWRKGVQIYTFGKSTMSGGALQKVQSHARFWLKNRTSHFYPLFACTQCSRVRNKQRWPC